MKPTFLGEGGKRTRFMSFWRTWGKQEEKERGFYSASFETRQAAWLNKQGLHKHTDNNLKLYKQNLHSTVRAVKLAWRLHTML